MEKACKQENKEQKRKELILRTEIQRRSHYETEKLIRFDYQNRITKKHRRDKRKTKRKVHKNGRTNRENCDRRSWSSEDK